MRECHRSRARDIIRIRLESFFKKPVVVVVRGRRDGFSKTSQSIKSRAKPQSPNLSRSTALVVGFPRRQPPRRVDDPGTRTRPNVKRTFSSFSTASAYRRWRGACASCHERYLRVGKERKSGVSVVVRHGCVRDRCRLRTRAVLYEHTRDK